MRKQVEHDARAVLDAVNGRGGPSGPPGRSDWEGDPAISIVLACYQELVENHWGTIEVGDGSTDIVTPPQPVLS